MTEPSARIIADSITEEGQRLTTLEIVMHRFVLAEFNTHRVFSRNSASSRAIPLHTQLERVANDMMYPVVWASEKKGMSGGDAIPSEDEVYARSAWDQAREAAVGRAQRLGDVGVHKSIANRLLEPFMSHTVIVTATAYQNFDNLRVSPLAQPEIENVAAAMHLARSLSDPAPLLEGAWHLPYIQDDERGVMPLETQIKVSAARCARVSYLQQNGVRDFERDVGLYGLLTNNGHSSPLEHVATPAAENAQDVGVTSRITGNYKMLHLPKYGNFIGWHQHRFDVEVDRDYQAFA